MTSGQCSLLLPKAPQQAWALVVHNNTHLDTYLDNSGPPPFPVLRPYFLLVLLGIIFKTKDLSCNIGLWVCFLENPN